MFNHHLDIQTNINRNFKLELKAATINCCIYLRMVPRRQIWRNLGLNYTCLHDVAMLGRKITYRLVWLFHIAMENGS